MEKNKAVLATRRIGATQTLYGPYTEEEAQDKKRKLDSQLISVSSELPKPVPYWQTQIVTLTF